MDYCLVVKESMRQRLDRSRHQAGLNGCGRRAGAIWRVTEREASADAESAGSRCMDGTKDNTISGGDALTGHTRSHPEHDG